MNGPILHPIPKEDKFGRLLDHKAQKLLNLIGANITSQKEQIRIILQLGSQMIKQAHQTLTNLLIPFVQKHYHVLVC